MERRSTALFAGGIAAMALAPVGLTLAVFNLLEKDNCQADAEKAAVGPTVSNPYASPQIKCTSYDGFIIGSIATSFVLAGGGLAMFLVGGEKVPTVKETAKIRPWVSPSTAGLSVQATF